jgi:hypothetical protein
VPELNGQCTLKKTGIYKWLPLLHIFFVMSLDNSGILAAQYVSPVVDLHHETVKNVAVLYVFTISKQARQIYIIKINK